MLETRLLVADLLREFSGWHEAALNGDIYQDNMVLGIQFIGVLPIGLTRESGIKCSTTSLTTLTWSTS